MKTLVATSELLGKPLKRVPRSLRQGSLETFSYVPDGELVMPLVCWELLGCSEGGCARALGGMQTAKATTNFKVVEDAQLTLELLQGRIAEALKAQGWVDNKQFPAPPKVWAAVAFAFAGALCRAADSFLVGDIVSKKGAVYWSRKDPSRRAKVILKLK